MNQSGENRESNSDHDLLVRIDEQMKALKQDFAAERLNNQAAGTRAELAFDIYRRETSAAFDLYRREQNKVVEEIRDDIGSLQKTRIQIIAAAGTLSTAITLAMRFFWPK